MPGTKKTSPLPSKPTTASGPKLLKQKASLARLHGLSRADNPEVTLSADEGETWLRAKQILKPQDQEDLSELELNEEIQRVLTANNPHLQDNMVQYSFKEGSFVPVVPSTHEIVLLHVEGVCLHKDSEEAKQQLNAEGGSFPDYKYWEDPADQYREDEGTLLPLWKFSYEKTKKNNVTYLCWNPQFHDCFAAAFGSFDFTKQVPEGGVCLFTLKNPSYPEYVCDTECGVMCVDVHPKCSYLMVIGRYDGNVAVYDVHVADREPQHESNSVANKHAGIIWEVKWGRDMPDGELNFFSVSEDGHVYNWVLMQNELARTVVIALSLLEEIAGPDGSSIPMTACGTTIAFHPSKREIFLVGSEEGYIFKCSTAYSSMFLDIYKAHHMPITRIAYNLFYPSIFVSSSSDWRVKIWEEDRRDPLFIFDLGSPVCDVGWSPFSSTVFGAVTSDGKTHVFDLNINKYRAICIQNIVSKKKNQLTRLAFNYKEPVLIVGDDRGGVTSLKLSPNLRKEEKPSKKGPTVEPRQLEINKLEKLLALVRDPPAVVKMVDRCIPQEITK
ncbi:dynein intermediate chain 2, ciliary [Bacillus rossius redtenbacheri]|uniref:dynein intermediate chain 2, ciliary n=1 Tax=Bacillus rossius redtenbacheri TaxID=93214 RepID=UPI002FDD99A8